MKNLIEIINSSKSIALTTHKESDGDGLGAQLALYHALKKINRDVQIVNVDSPTQRYEFLDPKKVIKIIGQNFEFNEQIDLLLVFDTNDQRLLGSAYSSFSKYIKKIVFIDHHPILREGPSPTDDSFIDTTAASTGEITFRIIKGLGIELDSEIARCLYSSIAFDTQIFRYIRNSPNSHLICAELLKFGIVPQQIHQDLFGYHTAEKISFLALALSNIEYFTEGRVAFLKIKETDLKKFGLGIDATKDVIDMIMNINTVEIAALVREDKANTFKISLRSKGNIPVIEAAESLGGGGHPNAAGAYFNGPYEELKNHLIQIMMKQLKAS